MPQKANRRSKNRARPSGDNEERCYEVCAVGFLGGSILFGDLFPVWGEFYNSDYRGVYRLDQLFDIGLGITVLIVVAFAIVGIFLLRLGQRYFWPDSIETRQELLPKMRWILAVPIVVSLGLALYPTDAFVPKPGEPDYYIVPKEPAGIGKETSGVDGLSDAYLTDPVPPAAPE